MGGSCYINKFYAKNSIIDESPIENSIQTSKIFSSVITTVSREGPKPSGPRKWSGGNKEEMSKKEEDSMIDKTLGIPRQRGETIIKNLAEVGNIMLDLNYITKQLEKLEKI